MVQRRNKSSCRFGHFISLLWPQRRRGNLRTLLASVHEDFSIINFLLCLVYCSLRKILMLTHLTHCFSKIIELHLTHSHFINKTLEKDKGASSTSGRHIKELSDAPHVGEEGILVLALRLVLVLVLVPGNAPGLFTRLQIRSGSLNLQSGRIPSQDILIF